MYLFLTMILLGASYFYLHFIDKETKPERVSNEPIITQPVGGRRRIEPRQSVSRSHHFKHPPIIVHLALVWDWCWGFQKLRIRFPWWRSGWESACQCRGHGFEPWSGKIPHAAERLGPWATIAEPARLKPVLRNKRGRDSERPAHRDEEWPPLATTRESPRTETKTQHSHK